jgi:hypothetical protein
MLALRHGRHIRTAVQDDAPRIYAYRVPRRLENRSDAEAKVEGRPGFDQRTEVRHAVILEKAKVHGHGQPGR